MTDEAIVLGNKLLQHLKQIQSQRTSETVTQKDMIPYGKLCDGAGLGYLTQSAGRYLCEIAEWCFKRNLPPLNSLAVNAQTRRPGPGFDGAPGCSEIDWWNEVIACVDCRSFPDKIS